MAALCEPGPFTRLLHDSGLLGALRKAEEDGSRGAVGPRREAAGHPRPQRPGPYIGPRGGKWADPEHTIPWKPSQVDDGVALDDDADPSEEPGCSVLVTGSEPLGPVKAHMTEDEVREAIGGWHEEIGVIFGQDGKQLARATSGSKRRIRFDKESMTKLRDVVKANGSVKFLHNHPSGLMLSGGDVAFAVKLNIHAIESCNRFGDQWWVERPRDGWTPQAALKGALFQVVREEERVSFNRERGLGGVAGKDFVQYTQAEVLELNRRISEKAKSDDCHGPPHFAVRHAPGVGVRRGRLHDARRRDSAGSIPRAGHGGEGTQVSRRAQGQAQGDAVGSGGDRGKERPLDRLRRLLSREKGDDIKKAQEFPDLPNPLTFTALLEQLRANGILAEASSEGQQAAEQAPSDTAAGSATRTRQHIPHSAHPVKLGPPPEPNRAEHPFVGTIEFQGLVVDVENRKGSYRSGKNADGTPWRVKMLAHYGEIRGTEGTDGDPLDAYVGDNADSSLVVVVHQRDPETREYDEDKVMLGFDSADDAVRLYRRQYDRPGFYESHTTMPIGQLWRWVRDERNHGRKVVKKGRTMSDNVISLQTWTDQVLQKGKTNLEDAVIEAELRNALRRHLRWREDTHSPEVCARHCADEVITQYAMLDATKVMLASYLDRRGPDGLYVQALVSHPAMAAEVQSAREAMAARALLETHGPQSAYAVNGY